MHYKKYFTKKTYYAYGLLGVLLAFFIGVCISTYTNPIPGKHNREQINTSKNIVNDVTELNPIQTKGILVPHSEKEIQEAVKKPL